ncbi:hypothetical protein GGI18_004431 [Coemansia linderi]|uniref:Uncharacterized protein n=1 Tax=Coemansia linderi TaxID=2663919 RepID=A0ACC1K9A8_9FUNG|nr:hypothetical protein GGI18_004431 [Coemansia linderi]
MYARHCLRLAASRACHRPTTALLTLSRRFASELPPRPTTGTEAREALAQGTRDLLNGSMAAALKSFERALNLGEATADTYYNKGVCEYSLGLTDKAISSWERSLALDSSRADVHANIGNAYYLNKRDPVSALSHMKRAAELAPEDAEIQFNLGCLCESGDDLKAAISAYDQAAQLGLEKAKTHLRNAMAKQMKRQL